MNAISSSSKILVTGFLPFGGRGLNPSQRLVERLGADLSLREKIQTALLPVSFRRAPEELRALLETGSFHAVLMFGLAERRDKISLERMSVNWADSLSADEDGVHLAPGPLEAEAPALFSSALPLERWVAELKAMGIPAEVSLSAGGFVCNAVSYSAASWLAASAKPSLFVHIPLLPEQAVSGEASLSFELMEKAARFLIGKLASA